MMILNPKGNNSYNNIINNQNLNRFKLFSGFNLIKVSMFEIFNSDI